MRVAIRITAAAVLGGTGLGIGAISSASATGPPPTYTCSGTLTGPGTIPSGTYSGLVMPTGSLCEIAGPGAVSVLSPVTLTKASGLVVAGGGLTVQGSLTVGPKSAFAADLRAENAPVNIIGSVTVRDDGAFYLGTEVPGGPVFASIEGSVTGNSPSAVVIQNTRIFSWASVSGGGHENSIVGALSHHPGGANYTDFEDDRIGGPVTEVGYGGIWGGVIRSVIHGNLAFAYNSEVRTDEYDIGSDVIFGSAYCAGNNPPPNMGHSSGSPSIVHGQTFGDQASTCTGVPGGGTGPPPSV
jgi:hypothetical protein